MGWLWGAIGAVALASAFATVVLGRNLTRSVTAGYVFLATGVLALVMAGGGFLAWMVAIGGTGTLAIVQVFGWMLVDVDRDHLPPTERPTIWARGLAFVLLGLGLGLLVTFAVGELGSPGDVGIAVSASEVGVLLFAALREEVVLLGLAIAGALLATLLLLQDDEGED